jgi:hypothetical protein
LLPGTRIFRQIAEDTGVEMKTFLVDVQWSGTVAIDAESSEEALDAAFETALQPTRFIDDNSWGKDNLSVEICEVDEAFDDKEEGEE